MVGSWEYYRGVLPMALMSSQITREEPSAWADSSSRVLRVTLCYVTSVVLLDQSDELGCLAEGCKLEVTLCTLCVATILLNS